MRSLFLATRLCAGLFRPRSRGMPPLLGLVVGAIVLLGAAIAPAAAQTSTGNLRGYITGTGGTPVEGAQITARYLQGGQPRLATTNAAGFFYLGGLRPGEYDVNVRRVGLAPQTRVVSVPIGETVDLPLTLTETAVQLTAVQVQATSGTTTRTSEVGTDISRAQIANLPNFERNILDLARLAPGITAQDVNSTDKVISAGGQPPEAINIFVDGASYKNDVLRGGVVAQDASKGNPFPEGAVQEFRVITQNFKAEYQKAASLIITATTRTGGNDVEGDAFVYGVGKSYVARDAFTRRVGGPRPQYDRLQAGASLGGPIARDKLFFFGTYELNFRDEPAYIRLGGDSLKVPAALRQQLDGFTGQQAQQFREHLGFGKLSWVASPRSTVDASVNIRHDDDFRGFGGTTAFESAENLRENVTTGVMNWKYAGDRYLNEFQASAQGFTWNPIAKNFGLIGRNYINVLRVGGKDSDQDFRQDRFSFRNDVTRGGVHLGGDHVFKVGANVDFLGYRATKYFLGNPVFNYRVDENYSQPFEAQFGFGDPTIKTNNTQFGGYAQDDWTIARRLTLNLGLRWDAETNMINNGYVTPQAVADSLRGPLNGQLYVTQPYVIPGGGVGTRQVRVIDELGGLDRYISNGRSSRPIYLKAFQPRFGFSYDATESGSTVLFGGAGIYFDRNYWNTLFDEQFRRQFKIETIEFRNSCTVPGSPTNCAVWDPKYFDPAQLRTLSGSAGVPEIFLVANDLKPPRTVQLSGGVRQTLGPAVVTLSYNGLRGTNYMNFVHAAPYGGLGPNYATLFIADDRVKTFYDAMELQIQRPLRADTRWGGGLAYTLAISKEQGQSTDIFWGFDDRYPTVADRPILRAPGDQRHTVVLNGIARAPYGILVSTIMNFGSGIAQNATNATAGFGVDQQFTYVYSPPTRPFLGLGHVFTTQNVDLRLEKDITLGTGQTIGLLADVFNAFNTANFSCFNNFIGPGGPDQNYGKPNCAGLGRRLQIGLRYGVHPSDRMSGTR